MSITFVVPAFNEAESIPALFQLISDLDSVLDFDVALLIVENGSLDFTRRIIRENILKFSGLNVNVIDLDLNIGYGGAMKMGISSAKSQVVALLPADGKYELVDIKRICDSYYLTGDDTVMVKGYRKSRNDPHSIQFLSVVLTAISNMLFGTSLKDVNGLPKVFKCSPILDQLAALPDDACFDVGLVAIWNRNRMGIQEIPVKFTQHNLLETSWAGKRIKTALRMLFQILKFSARLKKEKR